MGIFDNIAEIDQREGDDFSDFFIFFYSVGCGDLCSDISPVGELSMGMTDEISSVGDKSNQIDVYRFCFWQKITQERHRIIDSERNTLIDNPEADKCSPDDHEGHTRIDPEQEDSHQERPGSESFSTIKYWSIFRSYHIAYERNMREHHGDFFDIIHTSRCDVCGYFS